MIDPILLKKDFPLLARSINGAPIVYLDSAATTQKPVQVVNAVFDYYFNYNANVSRGVYSLAEESTDKYDLARKKVAHFLNATPDEIIFTYNSTYALNIAIFGYIANILQKDDIVVSLISEHHSSLVPLQQVALAHDAKLEVLPLNEDFSFPIEAFENLLKTGKVKAVSFAHVSNVLGNEFPLKEICEKAHKYGALVLIDGSQSVGHTKINLKNIDCDFFAFSGHKMLGPMGIGVLYAKSELISKMNPLFFGGGMIKKVFTNFTTFKEGPEKLEPGTPNVEGAYTLARAIDYLESIGMENVEKYEKTLTNYALQKLKEVSGIHILGGENLKNRTGIISFVIDGIHSHDIAASLNSRNIFVRSGQHCTMPLHDSLKISSSVRASFYIYNSFEDIDKLIQGLQHAISILKH